MNTSNKESFDIIIVGGGLVGLSMAALLAQSQEHSPAANRLRIALLDAGLPQESNYSRDAVENFDPRVSALTVTSQQLFASLGLWEQDLASFACPYTDMYVWDTGGIGDISFSCREVRQAQLGHIIENTRLDRALNHYLGRTGLEQYRGNKLRHLERQEEQSLLLLDNGQTLSCRLLIAADGGNSFIRQQAGFTTREWAYGHQAIVATVATEKPHAQTAAQCFLPSGPLAFLPLRDSQDTQHYSSIVWSCTDALAQELLAMDEDQFRHDLQQAFENRLGQIEAVGPRFSFPLWQRHARDYVQEGLALVGDAAHTIHPLAGQGVNLGLADVHCLAGIISAARAEDQDIASHQVLSRYQRQRKGHNLGMMALMEGFKRGFGSDDLLLRWARNTGLALVDSALPLKRQLMQKAMGL
ncbi:MAG: 2-octaprenyl-3-methyl-6-methoxy-1,4-benzoquinol hydroxylase [Gammaproteobacteria bacterium]|nr:2-octaprenyl-3-methyl-6-methoxy-1,4-benzoquinol hydroxylase [Gammaproteobacteria bacterium]